MRRHLLHLLMAAAAWLLTSGTALAQEASPEEAKLIQQIFGCMAAGLPQDWEHAMMTLELSAPGAMDGDVRYVVVRGNAAEAPQNFRPCDLRAPAQALIEARERQAPERRGWVMARLAVHRDGKYELNYEYPK